MMRIALIFLIACSCFQGAVFASEKEFIDPINLYQNNYFITGDTREDQVKFQMSVKYNLLWPFDTGLFFGYTQRSYWRIYDDSSPFQETNYCPEFFYRYDPKSNVFNFSLPFIDYIQVSPMFHRSNGLDKENSRSENKYYGEVQTSYGRVYNVGARGRVFGYYDVESMNKDINKYHKNYSAAVFFKLMSSDVSDLEKEKIELSWGGNPFDDGWYQVELSMRIISSYAQPRIFMQFYQGYDEFMIHYNERTTALRFGLKL